jgi:hypothetical protein
VRDYRRDHEVYEGRKQTGRRSAHAGSRLKLNDVPGRTLLIRQPSSRAKGCEQAKVMTLASDEFIRRFLIHVLPHGFHRIRHYGLFISAGRAENIARARELLHVPKPQSNPTDADMINRRRSRIPVHAAAVA